MTTTPGQRGEISLRPLRWVAVVALGLSVFMSALDSTIVALALPNIAAGFGLSDSAASLLFLAYAVPLTILVLPSGALIKKFPTLPTFAASALGFGVGSFICGVAPGFPVLLAGRVIQGSFAAVISTQVIAVAGAIVAPDDRGRAMGLMGTIAPLGGVVGPGLGGVLLSYFGWPSIFFVNLPVCFLAAGLGLLSLGGFRLPNWGAAQKSVYAQMSGLLKHPMFVASILAFFFSVTMSVALYYIIPFDLGGIQGLSPSLSGAVLLTVPLGMMGMGLAGGYLTDKYSPRPFVLIGAGVVFLGVALLSFTTASRASEMDLVWRLLLVGSGIGLFSSPTSTIIMGFGGREGMAAASSLTNLAARLGTVVGPIAIGSAWALMAGLSAQIATGMLLVDSFAGLTLLTAVLSVRKSPRN